MTRKIILALVCLVSSMAFGQLPRYTVSTLPSASANPHTAVQVIDGASITDCTVGGGTNNVICSPSSGAWSAMTSGGFNVAAPGPIGGTTPNKVYSTDSISTLTPVADIRAYGAVADGATPIDTALLAALTALKAGGTNVANPVLFLPCGGSGCYLSNGALLAQNYTGTTKVVMKLQGSLKVGSTFVPPRFFDLVCDGGVYPAQFQTGGTACGIIAPNVAGTLGTAITTTLSPVTFTPTFTNGSITNFVGDSVLGSAITVAETTTCSATSVTRTTDSVRNVTASLSTSCRIPPGTNITVAGCSDATLNGTFLNITSDYVNPTLVWTQSGSASSGVTGCTVTGLNEDTFETTRITAVSGSTLTAVFQYQHASTANFGMVAIAPRYEDFSGDTFNGITVSGNRGAGMWLDIDAFVSVKNSGFGGTADFTSIPFEADNAWWLTLDNDTFNTTTGTGYPWSIHCTAHHGDGGAGCGFTQITNSVINGGLKIDAGGHDPSNWLAPPLLINDVIEQPVWGGITVDPRYGYQYDSASFNHVELQDNFHGYIPYYLAFEDQGSTHAMQFNVTGLSSVLTGNGQFVNGYFTGGITVNGVLYDQGLPPLPIDRGVPLGVLNNGKQVLGEHSGEGDNLSPSVIPYATKNVTQDPTAWTCQGTGCSVTTGVLAPDGSTNAGTLTVGSSGSSYITAGGISVSTAAGDTFLFGGWVQSSATNANGPFQLQTYGATDVFGYTSGGTVATSNGFDTSYGGMWWHPVVASARLKTGTAGAHTIQLNMYAPSAVGATVSLYKPFLIHIPASAGISDAEIERWRTNLLHGIVPSNMPAGGGILAMGEAQKLYWGNDTNLYRDGTNGLKTDNQLAVLKLKLNDASCTSGTYAKGDGSGCGTPTTTGSTVTYTASQTASTSDNGKLVLMNCASACSYTLPATQPSTAWYAKVMSTGSTLATIVLGGSDTFNGGSTAPLLNKYRPLLVYANSATATDYEGDAPLVAGTNITLTPSSSGTTVSGTTQVSSDATLGGGSPSSTVAPSQSAVQTYTATNYLPMSLAQQLDTRPVRTVGLKPPNDAAATVNASSSTTLASLTGPGTLTRIQFASTTSSGSACASGNFAGMENDSTFTIVADGVTVLNAVPAGLFFNTYGYNSNLASIVPKFYRTAYREVDAYTVNLKLGADRRVWINFNSSLTVTWNNTSGCQAQIFSGIDWRVGTAATGLYSPLYNKFHATYVPFSSGSVAGTVGTVFYPLPTQTPGYPGLLDAIDVFILNNTNSASTPLWLEGHPVVTVDGTAGPSQKGTEDFFGGHWYFTNSVQADEMGPGFVGPCNLCSPTSYYTGMYRYFHQIPVTFNTSIAFSMENAHASEGTGTTVPITYASLVIWYTTN